MNRTLEVIEQPGQYTPNQPYLPAKTSHIIRELAAFIEPYRPPNYPEVWVEMKLLEGDTELSEQVRSQMSAGRLAKASRILTQA